MKLRRSIFDSRLDAALSLLLLIFETPRDFSRGRGADAQPVNACGGTWVLDDPGHLTRGETLADGAWAGHRSFAGRPGRIAFFIHLSGLFEVEVIRMRSS